MLNDYFGNFAVITEMFYRRNRRRQNNFGIYLLAYELFNSRYIPPVTLIVIIFQLAVFLGYIPILDQHETGMQV